MRSVCDTYRWADDVCNVGTHTRDIKWNCYDREWCSRRNGEKNWFCCELMGVLCVLMTFVGNMFCGKYKLN